MSEAVSLLDFDWDLKLVVGSSSLASLQELLFKLDFHLGDAPPTPVIKESFNVELDCEELSEFINKLEAAAV